MGENMEIVFHKLSKMVFNKSIFFQHAFLCIVWLYIYII